jgi:hypothetical protein
MVFCFLGIGRDQKVLADDSASSGAYTYVTAGNTLFVIKPTAQYMAAYRTDGGGLQLMGGRSFEFDHPSDDLSWYSKRDSDLTPDEMKLLIERAKKEKEKQEKRKSK